MIVPRYSEGDGYAGVEIAGDVHAAAFPLGGIGTGNVSVGARGQLCDWELWNGPGKGNKLPYSFFAMRCAMAGLEPVTRILEGRIPPPYESWYGFYEGDLAGFPRMASARLRGNYPFVEVDLHDDAVPVEVTMEAFTPLVPLDAEASGIPAAVIRYHVANTSESRVDVSLAGSLANAVGMNGYKLWLFPNLEGTARNEYREDEVARGVFCTSDLAEDHRRFGSMALLTTATDVTHKAEWPKFAFWDSALRFWEELSLDGRLTPNQADSDGLPPFSKQRVGSIASTASLEPGERHTFEFVVAWYFPNRPRGWEGHLAPENDTRIDQIVRNHYAARYSDAWHVGTELIAGLGSLESATRQFSDDVGASNLPAAAIDAMLCGVATLRSTTCFRIEDGSFLSWEGTLDHQGCCEGTVTHIWSYAQTAAFLFPELEHSMRRIEFLLETDESGAMAPRTYQVFGGTRSVSPPVADGQLGCIVRLFRDWRFCGDDKLLSELWPVAQRALEYATREWDTDGDGLLDNAQHNTYDSDFRGLNPVTNSVYFAALTAAALMSDHLGDTESATRYADMARSGAGRMDELLWSGEYYVQLIDDVDQDRYQYGTGVLADQTFGQYLAHVAGIGHVLPQEHARDAIVAVHRHNFRSMADHVNPLRAYALNDEQGLVLCTWPHGGRPQRSFDYCDEVWTGTEYQVAAQLAWEGETKKASEIVSAARDRHDGIKRNPWNEAETGSHFIRSMSSWSLLLAWSGYRYDAPNAAIGFDPRTEGLSFQCLFTSGHAWGRYQHSVEGVGWRAELSVRRGAQPLRRITLRPPMTANWQSARVLLEGTPVAATASRNDDGTVTWDLGEITSVTASLTVEMAS